MTTKEAARNPIYGVLSGPSGGVAGALFVAAPGRLRGHPHVRHGRNVDGRRPLPERTADDRPRDHDRPVPDQGALGQRAHRRRGRRLDRARAAADEGAPRRPAVGRSRARPGRIRQGRRGADRHRRERRARPSAAAAARRRDDARRRARAHRGAEDRGRDGARERRGGGRGDHRHRQREHGRRSAARLGPARARPA